MKKLFTMLLLLCCSVAFAQQSEDTLRLKHFSTWAVAPYLSLPFQYTDIEPISFSAKLTGVGINVEKHLSHYTSFQVGYFGSTLYNTKSGLDYRMELNQIDARFYVHITNGQTLRTWRNTQLYVYGGVGRLNHKSTIKDSLAETVKFVDAKALALQFGGGAKYRVGNRTALFIDGCANFTSSDRIDAKIVPYTNNDGYFKLSVGMSYTFGNKRMIEWDNPYKYLVPETVHDTTVVIKTIKYEAPIAVEPAKVDSTVIYYLTGSSSIEAPYLDQLDKLIDRANANGYGIQVQSYCDATGSTKKNADLVKSRADNVVKYLSKSFDVNHIMISTFDESAAVYAPEARNRRVVVKLIK